MIVVQRQKQKKIQRENSYNSYEIKSLKQIKSFWPTLACTTPPLNDVDRTKVDSGNLVGVIVDMNDDKSVAKVATKHGLLHRSYAYHRLQPVKENANDRATNDLEDAYLNWQGLPKISEREAARHVSSVGGQGVIKCNCKGDCMSNSCACKKAGRVCSSRCHRNSKCCKNISN